MSLRLCERQVVSSRSYHHPIIREPSHHSTELAHSHGLRYSNSPTPSWRVQRDYLSRANAHMALSFLSPPFSTKIFYFRTRPLLDRFQRLYIVASPALQPLETRSTVLTGTAALLLQNCHRDTRLSATRLAARALAWNAHPDAVHVPASPHTTTLS